MADLTWDAGAGRFRAAASGRFVSDQAVRQSVDDLIGKSADRMAALTNRLTSGQLRIADWQEGMRTEARNVHGVLATVAQGGKDQMSAADYGRLSARLRPQYERLSVFALDVAQGRLSGPQAAARARLYAEASRQTYGETQRQQAGLRGHVEGKWTRRASESCSGCLAQSARGWVRLDQLPSLGSQLCKVRCRCVIISRREDVAA